MMTSKLEAMQLEVVTATLCGQKVLKIDTPFCESAGLLL